MVMGYLAISGDLRRNLAMKLIVARALPEPRNERQIHETGKQEHRRAITKN
jgi:hypothetical protein